MPERLYRAPSNGGSSENSQERPKLPVEHYFRAVHLAVAQQLSWIIGDVPQYEPDRIQKSDSDGQYVPGTGSIKLAEKTFTIFYPHEYLHWLSRHRVYDSRWALVQSQFEGHVPYFPVITGVIVRTSYGQKSGNWLSEAIISETSQHVLAGVDPIFLGKEHSKAFPEYYVQRDVGMYYKSPLYSRFFGELLQVLVKKIQLSGVLEDNSTQGVVQFLQYGEFSLDQSNFYRLLRAVIDGIGEHQRPGNFKHFVYLSQVFDQAFVGFVRNKNNHTLRQVTLLKAELVRFMQTGQP